MRLGNYCPDISMETIFNIHDHKKQQNELSQILDLRSSNKHFALQNLSIYYT